MYSNVQMTRELVARLAYATTNKLIARLAESNAKLKPLKFTHPPSIPNVVSFDINKHECITFQSLDCDGPSYDQYEQTTIRAVSAASKRSGRHEYPPERGPSNGEKDGRSCDLQHAQEPDAGVRANDIPYLADVQLWAATLALLGIKWNALWS
ncbi:hypothetical protein BDR06DRAFT_974455 [Suillus hirtellus]|nr:hypothetical protein BDR06DRAFT_974455 [Suillus hirtellus]